MNIRDLLKFRHDRNGFSQKPKPRQANKLWSMWRTDEDDVEKLKELAASARRIEELMKQPGWADIISAKNYYISSYDAQTKNLTLTHEQRLIAAATWSGIEGLFKELSLRISAGNSAFKKLREINKG